MRNDTASDPPNDPSKDGAGHSLIYKEKEVKIDRGALHNKQWQLPNIRVSHWEGRLTQVGSFGAGMEAEVVTMLFVQKGGIHVQWGQENQASTLAEQTHNAFFPGPSCPQVTTEQLEVQLTAIEFEPQLFLELTGEEAPCWMEFARTIRSNKPCAIFSRPVFIDLAIQACIRQVLSSTGQGDHSQLFLRAKAMELMALQAQSWERQQTFQPAVVKTDYDRERILFAKDFLLQSIAAPPSLSQLARISGINEFKLKRGFKEMFGDTVFGYLAHARLELAKADLIEGRKSATEVAFELGYSSLQHFSTAFKKQFGVSPNQLKG